MYLVQVLGTVLLFLNLFYPGVCAVQQALVIRMILLRLLAGKLRHGEAVIGHGHEVPVLDARPLSVSHPEGFRGPTQAYPSSLA